MLKQMLKRLLPPLNLILVSAEIKNYKIKFQLISLPALVPIQKYQQQQL